MHVGSGAHTKMRDSLDLVINPHGTLQPAHAMSSRVKASPLRVVRGSCCGIWAAVQVLKHLTQVANAQQLLHAHRHAHVSDTQARSHEGAWRWLVAPLDGQPERTSKHQANWTLEPFFFVGHLCWRWVVLKRLGEAVVG